MKGSGCCPGFYVVFVSLSLVPTSVRGKSPNCASECQLNSVSDVPGVS